MERIANAIVSFFDLVEAEGRTLRQKGVLLIEGFLLMFFGAALLFFGVITAGVAVYMLLSCFMSRPAAALISAVVWSASGFALLSIGRKYSRDGGGLPEQPEPDA